MQHVCMHDVTSSMHDVTSSMHDVTPSMHDVTPSMHDVTPVTDHTHIVHTLPYYTCNQGSLMR